MKTAITLIVFAIIAYLIGPKCFSAKRRLGQWRRTIPLVTCLLFMTSCVDFKYGDAHYTRWGDQSLSLTMELDEQGNVKRIEFNQDAQAQALTEAIQLIGSLTNRAPISDQEFAAREQWLEWLRWRQEAVKEDEPNLVSNEP